MIICIYGIYGINMYVIYMSYILIFPSGSDGKESACNAGDQVYSLCQEDPLEKETATHSSILAWRIPLETGAWWATVGGFRKSQTWLSD